MRVGWRPGAAVFVAVAMGTGAAGLACGLDKTGLEASEDGSVDAAPDVTVHDSGRESSADVLTDVPFLDGGDASDAGDASDGPVESGPSLCQQLCTMPGGECVGDAGEICAITCADGCPSVTCPAGIPCQVDCSGVNGCRAGVDCTKASECAIQCFSACGDIHCAGSSCNVQCSLGGACAGPIDCQSTGLCSVACVASETCAGAIRTSSPQTTVDCSGTGSCAGHIACSGSRCGVQCASGACDGGECCDAGLCQPHQARTVCP